MTTISTINTPGLDQKTRKIVVTTKTGYVARLMVGNTRVKFFLQFSHDGDMEVNTLAHWASGWKVADLASEKLGHMLAVGSAGRLTDRAYAQRALNRLVDQHGEDKLLDKLTAAPVLNK